MQGGILDFVFLNPILGKKIFTTMSTMICNIQSWYYFLFNLKKGLNIKTIFVQMLIALKMYKVGGKVINVKLSTLFFSDILSYRPL